MNTVYMQFKESELNINLQKLTSLLKVYTHA